METVYIYLRLLDIFGYALTFKHNQSINYRTYFGGIMTILSAGFLIYSFIHISRDCFNKTNPIVRETSYYDDYTIVDGKKFFFSFYFTDDKFNFMPEPEKYLIFHGVITNYTDEMEIRTIPFIKCDYARHFNKTGLSKEVLQSKMKYFNDSYCLDIDEDFKLINSGTEIPRLALSIYVIECRNETIDNIDYTQRCTEKASIDKKLNSFMVNSYFFNSYIVTEEIIDPNKANIKKESLIVSNNHACDKLFITYKHSSVSIDYGFLFEDPLLMENIKISNYVPDQVPHTRDRLRYNIIYDVEIDADHFRTTTYVKFMKIQEALSSVGGIISIIKLVIGLTLLGVNKFGFAFALFSDVYMNGDEYINYRPKNITISSSKIFGKDNKNFENSKSVNNKNKNYSNIYKINNSENSNLENTKNIYDRSNTSNIGLNKNPKQNNFIILNSGDLNKKDKNKIKSNLSFQYFNKENNKNLESESSNNNHINSENNLNSENRSESPIKSIQENKEYKLIKKKQTIKDDPDAFESAKLKYNNLNNKNIKYVNTAKCAPKSEINSNSKMLNYSKTVNSPISNNFKSKHNDTVSNIMKYDRTPELKCKSNNENINTTIQKSPLKNESNLKSLKTRDINRVRFKLNFPTFAFAVCCKRKKIWEPANLVLDKINKELEIKNYIRLKEDIHIIKDLMIDPKDLDMFNKPLEFQEIYDTIKQNSCNYEGLNNYIKKSFSSILIDNKKKVFKNKNLKELENQFEIYKKKYINFSSALEKNNTENNEDN